MDVNALNFCHHTTLNRKQIFALNKLASLVSCNNLDQTAIDHIYADTDTTPNKALELRKINNATSDMLTHYTPVTRKVTR